MMGREMKAISNILHICCPKCGQTIIIVGKFEDGILTLNFVEDRKSNQKETKI